MRLLIRQLEEDDQRAGFDCGDETLNDYLRRFAWQNQVRNQVGVTRVAVEGSHPRLILGYYTLASASISRERLVEAGCARLPYPEIPAILLARLAVDRRARADRVDTAPAGLFSISREGFVSGIMATSGRR